MKSVGERLRERRKSRKLSLQKVAESIDKSKSYLSDLERGASEPSVWQLLADLAHLYSTSADYLLGLNDNPLPYAKNEKLLSETWTLQAILKQLSPDRRRSLVRIAQLFVEADEDLDRFLLLLLKERLVVVKNPSLIDKLMSESEYLIDTHPYSVEPPLERSEHTGQFQREREQANIESNLK